MLIAIFCTSKSYDWGEFGRTTGLCSDITNKFKTRMTLVTRYVRVCGVTGNVCCKNRTLDTEIFF